MGFRHWLRGAREPRTLRHLHRWHVEQGRWALLVVGGRCRTVLLRPLPSTVEASHRLFEGSTWDFGGAAASATPTLEIGGVAARCSHLLMVSARPRHKFRHPGVTRF